MPLSRDGVPDILKTNPWISDSRAGAVRNLQASCKRQPLQTHGST